MKNYDYLSNIYVNGRGSIAVIRSASGKKYAIDLYGIDQEFLDENCEGASLLSLVSSGFDGWDTIEDTDGPEVQAELIRHLEDAPDPDDCEADLLALSYRRNAFGEVTIRIDEGRCAGSCSLSSMLDRYYFRAE